MWEELHCTDNVADTIYPYFKSNIILDNLCFQNASLFPRDQ